MNQKIKNAIGLYIEAIQNAKPQEATAKYIGSHYRQHSTGVKDGKEGFLEFFNSFPERYPVRDIQILRSIVDEQFVFLHVFQNLNNGAAQWVTMDFFDTDENDKMIEHWDVIAKYADSTPSGHTMVDGFTEVIDLDKTEENKKVVKNLIMDGLMREGNPANLPKYISTEKYIQHNKDVADGLAHFQKLAAMPNRPLNYEEIVILVGQGNFVATLCRANWNDGTIDQDYAQADLFRLENGKVVEHWDCVEPVPEHSVNSGKF